MVSELYQNVWVKRTTIKTKLSKLNTLKKFVDEDILINKITLSYAQQVFDELDSKGYVYQNKDALSIFKMYLNTLDASTNCKI